MSAHVPDTAPDAPSVPSVSPVTPLSGDELRRALVRPDRLAEHVLGSPDRIARNLARGEGLGPLVTLLAAASLFAAVPYGAWSPVGSPWKVAVLFTGSLALCLPCLHVFLQFLGIRGDLARNAALALLVPATAALFTLGFFPIVWFIDVTTEPGPRALVTPAGLSRFLLGVCLLMGFVQMVRCLRARRREVGDGAGLPVLVVLWLPLLVFITWRMARFLGIAG
jgi:hypothetical protein